MLKSFIHSLLIFSMSASLMQPIPTSYEPDVNYKEPQTVKIVQEVKKLDPFVKPNPPRKKNVQTVASTIVEEPQYPLTEEEINLLALVTMGEAEGESEYGKRLVIDTILNRADHEDSYWPDTVTKVIYQKDQFEAMWNGRLNRCYVRDDIVELVKEELLNRTNSEVLYFRTGRYSSYGTPAFKEGNHYFSNY